jgi:hypothetical protein
MAITPTTVNSSKGFKKTKLIDRPVQSFKSAPNIKPNPYTGKGQTDAYARKHHLSATPPTTVLAATEVNPI